MCDISYGALVAHEILGAGCFKMPVQYSVESSGFVLVSVDAVLDLFRCVSEEVVRLALHWAHTSIQKEEPVVDFVAFTRPFWIGDGVFSVVLLDQVLHDAARLEKTDHLAVGKGIRQCRNPAVGVDFQEPRFLLRVLGDVNRMGLVWDSIGLLLLTDGKTLQGNTYPSSSKVMEILMPFGV